MSPWPRRLALATSALTLPLIFLGGRVTSTGSGMAVPDWPTTFGENMFFFPWSKWVGPVAIEHTHRLAAALVGLATIALAIVMATKEKRPGVRWLGFVALLLVIGQGVLGGMRVVLYEHGLAPIHGCVAQAFFGFIAAIVAITTEESHREHREGKDLSVPSVADSSAPRFLAIVTVAAIYLQIVLGAWYRHTAGARLEPHGFFALVVLGLAIALALKAKKIGELRPWARLLHAFLGVQLLLGVASWQLKPRDIPGDLKVAIVSMHLVFGALVLASAVAIAVLSFRQRATQLKPEPELAGAAA